ncbi:hypothetical protein [Neptuniibacter sp. QD37_11]|uniref:hypothetical protein n=1 Tax=Neptuniibacter sp. QD37_11 TaxID=3398209 RepID=UPI0039F473FC
MKEMPLFFKIYLFALFSLLGSAALYIGYSIYASEVAGEKSFHALVESTSSEFRSSPNFVLEENLAIYDERKMMVFRGTHASEAFLLPVTAISEIKVRTKSEARSAGVDHYVVIALSTGKQYEHEVDTEADMMALWYQLHGLVGKPPIGTVYSNLNLKGGADA